MAIPVLTVEQMREWEQATWATGMTEESVIQQVGEQLAKRILTLTQPGNRIVLLAGKGHNGDDTRAAAPHLNDRDVQLLLISYPAADLPILNDALARKPALLVDGLFGIGLNRPLDEHWCAIIEAINLSRRPTLSVDVPSGLNAGTGEPEGAAVVASVTLTVGAPKRGMLATRAARYVGRLEVVTDVGLIPCYHESELCWTLPEDFDAFPPSPTADAHKGHRGHLSIVAGSSGYHGAAVLTARGAQRAKPGLVTLSTHEAVYPVVASQLQGIMVRTWDIEQLSFGSAILVGPGLAMPEAEETLKAPIRKLWLTDAMHPMIVDASSLDWLPLGPGIVPQVRLLTPHPGEAARLLNAKADYVQEDRLRAVREVSARFGDCWVVLKGHQTLVGRSSGTVYVNSSGNPGLAQGGSGDLLAGYLGGLLAQPDLASDPLTTMRYGVWQHGASADLLERESSNWIVEDLADRLGSARPADGLR